MPNPNAPSCRSGFGCLLVTALLDLGDCMLPMAPCYLVVFRQCPEFLSRGVHLVWRIELRLRLQEAVVGLISCYSTHSLHDLILISPVCVRNERFLSPFPLLSLKLAFVVLGLADSDQRWREHYLLAWDSRAVPLFASTPLSSLLSSEQLTGQWDSRRTVERATAKGPSLQHSLSPTLFP